MPSRRCGRPIVRCFKTESSKFSRRNIKRTGYEVPTCIWSCKVVRLCKVVYVHKVQCVTILWIIKLFAVLYFSCCFVANMARKRRGTHSNSFLFKQRISNSKIIIMFRFKPKFIWHFQSHEFDAELLERMWFDKLLTWQRHWFFLFNKYWNSYDYLKWYQT